MERFESIEAMQQWSRDQERGGHRIAFVPTMGALHEGHRSLMRLARASADRVVVSIFVNPMQFDDPGDLQAYPVNLDDDLAQCAGEAVDAVFLPTATMMYPTGYNTVVDVRGELTNKLCGVTRDHHFTGVATVVTKLFNIVRPDVAWFGEKDLQQALIITRLTADLNLPITIQVGPTIREHDGLPLSSRNRRLSDAGRVQARSMTQALELARRAFVDGETDPMALGNLATEHMLVEGAENVDYAEVVSLDGFTYASEVDGNAILFVAAFFEDIRLIDHVHLGGPALPVQVGAPSKERTDDDQADRP